MANNGLTSSKAPAAPPYRNGPYTWDQNITFEGDVTVEGTFTFGDAATDNLIVEGDLRVNDDRFLHFGDGEDVSLEYDEDGDDVLKVTGALWHFANSGGAAPANAIFFGAGTSGSPATTSTANKSFIEFRTQSTATSGDSRALYLRHDLNGAGVSGEAIRAFSKITAAAATARGAHISLDVASAGSTSGLGVGVDNQILVHDGALSGGTYAVGNFEIYSAGSSTDVSGVTEISFLRFVAGGDGTGAGNVDDNAFFATFSGVAAGSGNMIDTDITTHSAYGGLRVNIPGVGTRYLALVSD